MPRPVSVVLPYRDAGATLREAAASVLAEESCAELLLVDDGSTDEGPRVARALASDPRVRLLHTEERGVARAMQLGLTQATHDLVARMDADDVSRPPRLARAAALLDADETLAVAATRVTVRAGDGPAAGGMQRYVAWQNGLITPADHAAAVFIEAPVCQPSVVLRASAILALGGYRDVPWPEDMDLWFRVVEAGLGIAKVPEELLEWRLREGGLTHTDPRCLPAARERGRAHYLHRALSRRAASPTNLGVWGAGKAGRRLVRALAAEGTRASFFIDIDPKKVGREAQGLPILDRADGLRRADFILVVVAAWGARDVIEPQLRATGRAPIVDYLFAS